ncbi:hypothetical protein B0T26DRAFT_207848 [Lasiosphaeria miniovina]|uniref:Uncharacterized protein n=1 Tax=Lasiosphaeria miniovina TaxID=1954250 RepID=A0AA40E4G9_9PEZI|nr:uncharacterized protein B0T26DRAFT_207848 [Lasiosphaeria miniovina]KAK0722208.1 hypothetical protein B0T26DRAFT_207848 [Lasiosphaeria miniovina]
MLDEVDFALKELSIPSSRLEYLPPALVQATTTFIQENTITVGDHLQLINQSDQNLLNLLSEEFETVGRDSGASRDREGRVVGARATRDPAIIHNVATSREYGGKKVAHEEDSVGRCSLLVWHRR